LNQFVVKSVIHVGKIFQAAPVVSFAVKPDGLFQSNDGGVPSAEVLPVTMAKLSEGVILRTVLQVTLLPFHQGYLGFCSFNHGVGQLKSLATIHCMMECCSSQNGSK
jgi:hypothetical protein